MELQQRTVHSGYTRAQCHSGLLGRGPTIWPTLVAFGQPMTHRVQPVRDQRAPRAQCMVTMAKCGQCMWRSAVSYSVAEVHR
jgi:hypothetical protein